VLDLGANWFMHWHFDFFRDEPEKIKMFKEAVQYFIDGTHEGYMRSKPKMQSSK